MQAQHVAERLLHIGRLHVDVGYAVKKFAITERFDLMNSAQLRVRDADAS